MQNFIRNENLKLYRRALAESSDEEQRQVIKLLLRLLIVEEAALARPKKRPGMSPTFE